MTNLTISSNISLPGAASALLSNVATDTLSADAGASAPFAFLLARQLNESGVSAPDTPPGATPDGSAYFTLDRHGASSTTKHENACANRFPLPIPLPHAGEGNSASLRDFHAIDAQAATNLTSDPTSTLAAMLLQLPVSEGQKQKTETGQPIAPLAPGSARNSWRSMQQPGFIPPQESRQITPAIDPSPSTASFLATQPADLNPPQKTDSRPPALPAALAPIQPSESWMATLPFTLSPTHTNKDAPLARTLSIESLQKAYHQQIPLPPAIEPLQNTRQGSLPEAISASRATDILPATQDTLPATGDKQALQATPVAVKQSAAIEPFRVANSKQPTASRTAEDRPPTSVTGAFSKTDKTPHTSSPANRQEIQPPAPELLPSAVNHTQTVAIDAFRNTDATLPVGNSSMTRPTTRPIATPLRTDGNQVRHAPSRMDRPETQLPPPERIQNSEAQPLAADPSLNANTQPATQPVGAFRITDPAPPTKAMATSFKPDGHQPHLASSRTDKQESRAPAPELFQRTAVQPAAIDPSGNTDTVQPAGNSRITEDRPTMPTIAASIKTEVKYASYAASLNDRQQTLSPAPEPVQSTAAKAAVIDPSRNTDTVQPAGNSRITEDRQQTLSPVPELVQSTAAQPAAIDPTRNTDTVQPAGNSRITEDRPTMQAMAPSWTTNDKHAPVVSSRTNRQETPLPATEHPQSADTQAASADPNANTQQSMPPVNNSRITEDQPPIQHTDRFLKVDGNQVHHAPSRTDRQNSPLPSPELSRKTDAETVALAPSGDTQQAIHEVSSRTQKTQPPEPIQNGYAQPVTMDPALMSTDTQQATQPVSHSRITDDRPAMQAVEATLTTAPQASSRMNRQETSSPNPALFPKTDARPVAPELLQSADTQPMALHPSGKTDTAAQPVAAPVITDERLPIQAMAASSTTAPQTSSGTEQTQPSLHELQNAGAQAVAMKSNNPSTEPALNAVRPEPFDKLGRASAEAPFMVRPADREQPLAPHGLSGINPSEKTDAAAQPVAPPVNNDVRPPIPAIATSSTTAPQASTPVALQAMPVPDSIQHADQPHATAAADNYPGHNKAAPSIDVSQNAKDSAPVYATDPSVPQPVTDPSQMAAADPATQSPVNEASRKAGISQAAQPFAAGSLAQAAPADTKAVTPPIDHLPPENVKHVEFTEPISVPTQPVAAEIVAAPVIPALMHGQPVGSISTEPQQTINTPLGHRGWADELSQKIQWISTQPNQVAELHLNPPNLGPLDVVLKISDNQATILFTSPHGAVREAVENALPKLRETLSDNGIVLVNTTVSDQSPRNRNPEEFMNQNAGKAAPHEVTGIAAQPLPETPQAASSRRHNGILDTFA